MMKKFLYLFAVLIILLSSASFSQNRTKNYNILFKTGLVLPDENFQNFISGNIIQSLPQFDGKYYAFVQFYDTPTKTEREKIISKGIKLLNYLPHYSYFVSFPTQLSASSLSGLNIRHISALDNSNKFNPQLNEVELPQWALKFQGKIDLNVLAYSDADFNSVYIDLKSHADILRSYEGTKMFTIRVNVSIFRNLATLPYIYYVEPVSPDPVPDDTKGRSLHRSNAINSNYATGLHFDGTGVHVAIADDGVVGPHIDFTGRLVQNAVVPGGFHGDMTSGICVGAANLDPVIRGMATGATLYTYDIGAYPQINDAIAHLQNDSIVITSTSYSQGCNQYDAYSQQGDQQINQYYNLQHVFSAGNNNGADCGYGAGGQWGNITGGYKQGKNVIACANLTELEVLDASSSHGPSADGRIKPDIAANGTNEMSTAENNGYQVGGGTSAASPGVAGCFAQLFHAYRSMHGGADPQTGLIKACILNSANDIENPGPDYHTGWGRINAYKAYKVLADNRYLQDSIDQAQNNSHNITVPANVIKMKVMIYWPDVEGTPGVGKALVNDLDLTVADPSSVIHQPLVLDPTPNATTLNNPAVAGVDTLNNAEQVVIDNPAAGTYVVSVSGTNIPMGPQRYFMVYEFYYDDITVTYPWGNEGFVPGESELLRWDALSTSGSFTLEYSTDNGTNWNNMATVSGTAARQYAWTVPNTVTGQALVRVSRNGVSDVNDTTFTIINTPQNIQVDWVCPDSMKLIWTSVASATGYEVYMLGAKYMDPVGTSTTNSFIIPNYDPTQTHWVSVAALGPNGARGRRAIAIQVLPGTVNCPMTLDASTNVLTSPPAGTFFDCAVSATTPVTLRIKNTGLTAISNVPVYYSVNNGTPVAEVSAATINPGDSIYYTFIATVNLSVAGNYSVKAWNTMSGDMNSYNDTSSISLTIIAGAANIPPITEPFQTSFPPSAWMVINNDGLGTWQQSATVTGSGGTNTLAAFIDNYGYNAPYQEDALQTEMFNLTTSLYGRMTFDVSYAPYSTGFSDTMRIDISTDCGATFFPSSYLKGGLGLGTYAGGYNTAVWIPAAATDWRNDTLDLSSYLGSNLIVRFVNINQFGNYLYIDNVNIDNTPLSIFNLQSGENAISVYPNPSRNIFYLKTGLSKSNEIKLSLTDLEGRELMNKNYFVNKNGIYSLDLSEFSAGIYFLKLRNAESPPVKLVKF